MGQTIRYDGYGLCDILFFIKLSLNIVPLQSLISTIIILDSNYKKMGTKNIATIIATASLLLIVSMVFAYTKANIYSFFFGFLLCIIAELVILAMYCISKVQKAYSDSNTIKLTENHNLQFQKWFAPPKPIESKQIYLNAYTDEARLTTKKNSVQSFQFQQQTEEVQIDRVPYKLKIQTYLQQIRNQYQCLNKFNQALIDYGNRMMLLPKHSLLNTEHRFTKNQMCFVYENFNEELQYEEGRAFSKQLKIKMMKIKTKEENGFIKIEGENNLKNIVLPNWKTILKSCAQLGKEFRNIEAIKMCNSAVLQMVHKKIEDDYEILEKEISNSVVAISQLKLNIENLRKEHQKLQKYQTSRHSQDNIEIIYWLKKQYFEFTNLALRIKQNEKQYKLETQKLRYCKAKLNTFYQSQKIKYDKIIHTRCFAFLDAYRITLQESLNALRKPFEEQGYNYNQQQRPPKVNEPPKSKNMNELVAIQKNYQQQYFQRVDYYLRKIDDLQGNMEDLGIFLSKIKGIFAELIDNLKLQRGYTSVQKKQNSEERKALLMDSFFKALTEHSYKYNKIFKNLQRVNREFIQQNHSSLQLCATHIRDLCVKVQKLTIALDQTDGPLRQKYRVIRQQLNHSYKDIQQYISSVKEFEAMAGCHSNRIKKILMSSLTFFITQQDKWVIFYLNKDDKLKNMLNQSVMEQPNLLQTMNQNKLEEELTLQKLNNLQTGVLFSQEYRQLINRFFFVAYTQWSQSQLFRYTISKEIYIALNEDISEYFGEIVVQDFQSSGLPPQAVWIKQLNHDQGQFIIDVNLAFKGKVVVKISTKIIAFLTIPVQFQLQIEEFYAILRLCFIHNEMGCSWFSFVGEPLAKVTVFPKIGNMNINMTNVTNLLQNTILSSLKKFIYPIKKKIGIPLYKKDETYEIIQKRFESMRV